MPKSAQAFRTIREVADWLDVAAHVLRFWESKFNQIKPVKRAGGRRYYRPEDMALVGGIKVLLHDRGLTIRGVQKMIADDGVDAVMSLSPSVEELLGEGEVIDLTATASPSDDWDDDTAAEIEDEIAPASATEEAPLQEPQIDDENPTPDAAPPAPPKPAEPEVEPTPPVLDPTPEVTPPSATPQPLPAEGLLGTLVGFSQLPTSRRAALGPQIADLARLRDRMAAPHSPH